MAVVIIKRMESVVCWPGSKTIDPMVGMGGQHPATAFTQGASRKRSAPSPAFLRVNDAVTHCATGTSPRSIKSRSTSSCGVPRSVLEVWVFVPSAQASTVADIDASAAATHHRHRVRNRNDQPVSVTAVYPRCRSRTERSIGNPPRPMSLGR
jgi:hypothetical protein